MIGRLAIVLAALAPCGAVGASALPDGFVRLREVAPAIRQDIRYATPLNFTGQAVPGYERGECILTREAANAVLRAEAGLNAEGFGLVMLDCYRPARASRFFKRWALEPGPSATGPVYHPDIPRRRLFALGFIAATSAHSGGSTVDVGLRRLGDRPPAPPADPGRCDGPLEGRSRESSLDLGTAFDCFSASSSVRSRAVPPGARANREVLRRAMTREGFRGYHREWWHFSLQDEPFPETAFDFPVR